MTPRASSTRAPGPGQFGSGRRLAGFFDDPYAFYADLQRGWGDIARVQMGPIRMVVVHDLDVLHDVLIKQSRQFIKGSGIRALQCVMGEGLFTADGELHARHRKLAAPAFQPRNLAPYAPVMSGHARTVTDQWVDDQVVNIHFSMIDVSLGIAGEAMFGYGFSAEEREVIEHAVSGVNHAYRWLVSPGASMLQHLPLPALRRLRAGRRNVEFVVRDMLAAGRNRPITDQVDLLAQFLAARDEDDGSRFSDKELRDEAVTLLFAGHETVAASLAWIFAVLGWYPEIAARVREEVDAVLGGAAPDADAVQQLPYLRAVVSETLRLHPSVYSFVREPITPVDVGGYTISPGTDIAVPICSIHRDANHWPDPDVFNPDRFFEQDGSDRHRLAYMPFGTGSRVCIGSGFAWLQLVCVVATVVQKWTVELLPDQPVETQTLFTQAPKNGLPMRVRRRSDA